MLNCRVSKVLDAPAHIPAAGSWRRHGERLPTASVHPNARWLSEPLHVAHFCSNAFSLVPSPAFCCYDPAFLLRVDSSLCSEQLSLACANIYKKSWRESGKKLGVLKSMFSYCGDRSPRPSVFFRFFSFRIGTSCLVS